MKQSFALWTRPAIKALIRERFGVKIHYCLVGKYPSGGVYPATINTSRFLEFLGRSIEGATDSIYLVVDNLRVHHAKQVSVWLQRTTGVLSSPTLWLGKGRLFRATRKCCQNRRVQYREYGCR
jgi:hypothetical protein